VPAIALPRSEAVTPEARALGKRVVSLVGSMAEVEQMSVGVTQLPSQKIEGALGFGRDRPALVDMEAVPLPPPPPLQRRVAVSKRLHPRSR